VRIGNNPNGLNILDHNINRPEYVQLFSLLSHAAAKTPFNQSCVRMNTYGPSEETFTPIQGEPNRDDQGYGYGNFRPEEPKPKASASQHVEKRKEPKGRTSWISKAQTQLRKLMSEPEDEGRDI